MGHPVDSIDLTDEDAIRFRIKLIREEVAELEEALLEKRDPAEILKEACDVDYVLHGTLVALTNMPDPADVAFPEVHRSNMSKLGEDGKPVYREDGKILKGPNFSPADMGAALEQ